MKIEIKDLDHIHEAAKEFIKNMGKGNVFALLWRDGSRKDNIHQGSL